MAIADEAGGAWPEAARDAALLLSNTDIQEESKGVDLLTDIRSLFEEESSSEDFLPTGTILAALHKREDRPWGTMGEAGQAHNIPGSREPAQTLRPEAS